MTKSLNANVKINSLCADDILILSETEAGLNSSKKSACEYCTFNELTVNIDKTKCMILNKTGHLIRRDFFLDDIRIATALDDLKI